FFFSSRRRHTRFSRDWSSDVCSSDLMPVLVNVLLDADKNRLKVFATNLEVSLTDEAEAVVKSSGKVAVNAKSLFDILKELPEGRSEERRVGKECRARWWW